MDPAFRGDSARVPRERLSDRNTRSVDSVPKVKLGQVGEKKKTKPSPKGKRGVLVRRSGTFCRLCVGASWKLLIRRVFVLLHRRSGPTAGGFLGPVGN